MSPEEHLTTYKVANKMIIFQVLISGLLLGGIYALLSLGLNLIFGVIKVINFAHGDFVMVAMYLAFGFYTFASWDPYWSAIPVCISLFIFGFLIQRFLVQPTLNRPEAAQIFVTLGLGIVLQNVFLIVVGADHYTVTTSYQLATLRLGEIAFSVPRLVGFVTALIVTIGITLYLKLTFTGRAIRAVAMDVTAAQLMGIKVSRIYQLAFGLGSALAGLAGVLLLPIYPVSPTIGLSFVIVAFVVVVLGGLGSMTGAYFGGLIIGVIEALTGYFVSAELKQAVYLIFFIMILIVRPTGIFGLGMVLRQNH